MKLYDPERPKIYHKPAFLPGQHVIPMIHIWPLENNQIKLSMMLPLGDVRFSGKYFDCVISPENLEEAIKSFANDPEEFVKEFFANDPAGMVPFQAKTKREIDTFDFFEEE